MESSLWVAAMGSSTGSEMRRDSFVEWSRYPDGVVQACSLERTFSSPYLVCWYLGSPAGNRLWYSDEARQFRDGFTIRLSPGPDDGNASHPLFELLRLERARETGDLTYLRAPMLRIECTESEGELRVTFEYPFSIQGVDLAGGRVPSEERTYSLSSNRWLGATTYMTIPFRSKSSPGSFEWERVMAGMQTLTYEGCAVDSWPCEIERVAYVPSRAGLEPMESDRASYRLVQFIPDSGFASAKEHVEHLTKGMKEMRPGEFIHWQTGELVQSAGVEKPRGMGTIAKYRAAIAALGACMLALAIFLRRRPGSSASR
jgi:hypothetical protein